MAMANNTLNRPNPTNLPVLYVDSLVKVDVPFCVFEDYAPVQGPLAEFDREFFHVRSASSCRVISAGPYRSSS